MSEVMRKCSVCEQEIFFNEDGETIEGQSCPTLECPFFSLDAEVDGDGEPKPLDFHDVGC